MNNRKDPVVTLPHPEGRQAAAKLLYAFDTTALQFESSRTSAAKCFVSNTKLAFCS